MSLLWIEGGEGFGTSIGVAPTGLDRKYNIKANINLIDLEAGRTGGIALEMNGSGVHFQTFPLTTNPTLIIGKGLKFPDYPGATTRLLALYDGVTEGVNVRCKADGEFEVYRANTLLGTTTGAAVGQNNWCHFEIKVVTNDTTGSIELRVNGSAKLTLTSQDTQAGSNAYHDMVRFLGVASTGQHIDDIYICDGSGSANNNFLGNMKVVGIFPTAEGDTINFTPSTGTDNSALVDENPPNDDTDYVESSTVGQKDLYQYGDVSGLGNTIAGLQINTDVRETDASSFSLITVVKSNVTESDSAASAIGSTSYVTKTRVVAQDPDTSAAWTQAGINAAQFGMKVG